MRLLLIHGLGRTPLSLALLGRRLSQQGHSVRYFSYAAFQEFFDQIVGRLVATIRATANQHPYALIGHSLGGILARAALPALANMPPRHLVMLAPPNQLPLLAWRWRKHLLYRLMTRDCGGKLTDQAFYEMLPQYTSLIRARLRSSVSDRATPLCARPRCRPTRSRHRSRSLSSRSARLP
jgi:alpha-beta hydrolase superfamily lysophospholipase